MTVFDGDLFGILDLFSWRVLVPTTIGIVAALSIYYLGGRTGAAVVVACVAGGAGFCIGLLWDVVHRRFR
ncbi:hypothetical protein [Luteimonas sp. 3794]|uniref:hypothetical protein n=1 Tax=Luteimonas sp. 3794 TaxID=2817730 RepID=UPI002857878B|nr:hypothetical protein [Luteimonas sp. 3794]MDR6993183.1 LytS/YehU family sensor histidine kinase [Luteimonas sp. 3794]